MVFPAYIVFFSSIFSSNVLVCISSSHITNEASLTDPTISQPETSTLYFHRPEMSMLFHL